MEMNFANEYSIQETSWYKNGNILIIKSRANSREIFFSGLSVKIFEMLDDGHNTESIFENLKSENYSINDIEKAIQLFVKYKIIKKINQFEENDG